MRGSLAILVLSTGMLAQSPQSQCPADRPVDDIIAEVHKQQSKNKHRVGNPFPNVTCIWGWCLDHSRTPPTIPEPAPMAQIPALAPSDETQSDAGATRSSTDTCRDAIKTALEAAHNVEVGDYYFDAGNYPAALLRYQDAVKEKPQDLAVHVRLGRALEKQNNLSEAIDQYKAAESLTGPAKWSAEAKRSLLRLQRLPTS
ncbi:MAG: tetratricopeptide repeat protein [Acidobacteria bacterium]|nr:tetratricopeptide repeat protein [Acidobacteriota bacterium]